MQTCRSDEPNEAQSVAHSCNDLSELIQVVVIILEFAQLLDLIVKMLRPFIRIETRVIFLFSIFFEPFPISGQQILNILHK